MLKGVDLFAGCGGLSLGFQAAGISIQAAFEYWDKAIACYEKNFSHPIYQLDLSNVENAVKAIAPFTPNLIIGGPPCQDFSQAGKRNEAERASLTEAYAHIISHLRPTYFVMENVDRARKSNAYMFARKIFKESGYGLSELVLDASKCGVPQKRKRFFCIGILNQPDGVLLPFLQQDQSATSMTLRNYFGNTLGFTYYYRHPRNYNRRGIFSIDEPAPTIRGVNRPVPKGYPGHPNDACPLTPSIRALTTMERALIQTFPTTFQWVGNKTALEQMIGNAVPVKLAEFVATSLLKYIEQTNMLQHPQEFESWLVSTKHFTSRSARDTVSRCRRANRIKHIDSYPDAFYLFQLDQEQDYKDLSPSVRAQIKRSLQLYNEFNMQN